MMLASVSTLALVGCSGTPRDDTAALASAVWAPTVPAPPSPVVRLEFAGWHIGGVVQEKSTNRCHAVVIAPRWVLTAAHCFTDVMFHDDFTGDASGTVAGVFRFYPKDVTLAPGALLGVDEPRALVDHQNEISSAAIQTGRDVALVHLNSAITTVPTATLWHPPAPTPDNDLHAPDLKGQQLYFGGWNGKVPGDDGDDGDGTGIVTLAGLAPDNLAAPGLNSAGVPVLVAKEGPSGLQHGDSGGGAFATATVDSKPFSTPCAPTPGHQGELVLVGINQSCSPDCRHQSQADHDIWVPVYGSPLVEWLADTIALDQDNDHICDEVDNCVSVNNPAQANCNVDAENAWGGKASGGTDTHLGDTCDPAPCPAPLLTGSRFVTLPGTPPICDYTNAERICVQAGRTITDIVSVTPVLADGSSVKGDLVTSRFCSCHKPDGSPIPNPAVCAAAPYFCTLDPFQVNYEETHDSPPPGKTVWHAMARIIPAPNGPGTVVRGKHDAVAFPGPQRSLFRWAYEVDEDYWVKQNGWMQPIPPDPARPNGTDLAGALWLHDPNSSGNLQHGLSASDCSTKICGIADGYQFGVGPDLPTSSVTVEKMPTQPYPPQPPWAYCAACGDAFHFAGEAIVDPAPFVTVSPASLNAIAWLPGGISRPANDVVALSVRQALADPGQVWVPASEPISMSNFPSAPAAIAVRADGSGVTNAFVRTPAGFTVTSRATAPNHLMPLGGGAPRPRTGFGAALSRTVGALWVVGGTDRDDGTALNDVWAYREGEWTNTHLAGAPLDAQAAVYSHAMVASGSSTSVGAAAFTSVT